jgi:hypothetical protein
MNTLKENFCPSCITIPLAMSGIGLTSLNSDSETSEKHKRKKKLMLYTGLVITLLSFLIGVYYLCYKQCNDCR